MILIAPYPIITGVISGGGNVGGNAPAPNVILPITAQAARQIGMNPGGAFGWMPSTQASAMPLPQPPALMYVRTCIGDDNFWGLATSINDPLGPEMTNRANSLIGTNGPPYPRLMHPFGAMTFDGPWDSSNTVRRSLPEFWLSALEAASPPAVIYGNSEWYASSYTLTRTSGWVPYPDFNSPKFLELLTALIQKQYAHHLADERFTGIEIRYGGVAGCEGHFTGINRTLQSNVAGRTWSNPTDASRQQIYGAYLASVPPRPINRKSRYLKIETVTGASDNIPTMYWLLRQRRDIGLRRDGFGANFTLENVFDVGGGGAGWPYLFPLFYWHYLYGSFTDERYTPPEVKRFRGQIDAMHVDQIGNQFGDSSAEYWVNRTQADRDEITRILRNAGPRYAIENAYAPIAAKPGNPVTIAINWRNFGNASIREAYEVMLQLVRKSDGNVLHEQELNLDLEKLSNEWCAPAWQPNLLCHGWDLLDYGNGIVYQVGGRWTFAGNLGSAQPTNIPTVGGQTFTDGTCTISPAEYVDEDNVRRVLRYLWSPNVYWTPDCHIKVNVNGTWMFFRSTQKGLGDTNTPNWASAQTEGATINDGGTIWMNTGRIATPYNHVETFTLPANIPTADPACEWRIKIPHAVRSRTGARLRANTLMLDNDNRLTDGSYKLGDCSLASVVASTAKVLWFGDSITRGYAGAGVYEAGFREIAYTNLRAAGWNGTIVGTRNSININNAWDKYGGNSSYKIGQAGDANTALTLWADWPNQLALAPDVIHIHIGRNDCWNGAPDTIQNAAADRLEALIDKIHTDLPSAKVLVATIVPFGDNLASDATYNSRILAMKTAARAVWLTVYDLRTQAALTNTDYATGDTVHPGLFGYAKMAPVIAANTTLVLT